MGGLENQPGIGGVGGGFGLFLCLRTPEDKGDGLGQLHKRCHDLIGERLPAVVFVAVGLTLFYGENGVEQKDALLCPVGQIAAGCRRDPRSASRSLKILTREGGSLMPGCTEKASP